MENININLGKVSGKEVSWDYRGSVNGHAVLIGTSGSGKTVQAQKMIVNLVDAGETVIVIDSHGCLTDDQIFPPFKEQFERYRCDIDANEDGIPCSLFTAITYPNGYVENGVDTVGAITDIFCRAYNLGINQRTSMRLAIDDVFRKHSYESEGFQAVGFALMKAGDKQSAQLYERMLPLFSRNVFREGSGLVQKNKINIIHLSRMDLATQHVVTEMLLSYFWRLGNADQFKGEGKISIFLDECQNLDASKNAPLSQLISEGRKMGISLLLATQMIIAGSNSAVQQRILQSGLQLYFKPANNQVMQTAKLLNTGNENMWANVLGNLKTGQFVALGNLSIGSRSIDYPIVVDARIEENNTAAGAANKGSLRGTVRMR